MAVCLAEGIHQGDGPDLRASCFKGWEDMEEMDGHHGSDRG